ncbi:MAG: class I SAM-dependent methyltransferase [Hyphomicrobiaceae bacterium]
MQQQFEDGEQKLDETGKIVLDDIYNQKDPRAYFTTLGELDYCIPEAARPVFANIIEAYKSVKNAHSIKVVDLGCSYGVNAALMKTDMTMRDLYNHYAGETVGEINRDKLLALDQRIFASEAAASDITVIGLDAAPNALDYAEKAGIIDGQIHANLEQKNLQPAQQHLLRDSDLVVSTGCIGYIGERTLEQVLDASPDKQPWMAHFVLRMFPFDPIGEMLAERGYVTAKGSKPVQQRLFASEEEQSQVLARLIKLGIDPSGLEADGAFYADLYVSRPAGECDLVPAMELTAI